MQVARRACDNIPADAPDDEPLKIDSTIAVVFSVAAIEAWINDLQHDAGPIESDQIPPRSNRVIMLCNLLQACDREPTMTKLEIIFAILANQTIDKGRAPFQDLAQLINLRNAIVHRRPETIAAEPSNIIKWLRNRKLVRTDDLKIHQRDTLSLSSTRAVAKWACKTVGATVNYFADALRKMELSGEHGEEFASGSSHFYFVTKDGCRSLMAHADGRPTTYVAAPSASICHKPGCHRRPAFDLQTQMFSERDQAIDAGLKPCKLCKP